MSGGSGERKAFSSLREKQDKHYKKAKLQHYVSPLSRGHSQKTRVSIEIDGEVWMEMMVETAPAYRVGLPGGIIVEGTR